MPEGVKATFGSHASFSLCSGRCYVLTARGGAVNGVTSRKGWFDENETLNPWHTPCI